MKTKTNVLYLTYDGLTDPLGESQILPYLLGLSSEFSITVVSFEKPGMFIRKQKMISDLINGRILWVPKSYTKYPPVLSSLYDLVVLRKACTKLLAEKRFKIIHCRSYLTSLVGLEFKKKYSIKFIFDMRGFWADERIEGGIWNGLNPVYKLIYRYFKKKETGLIQQADHIIVLTNKAKNILEAWGRVVGMTVIPCCVDTHLFNPDTIPENDRIVVRKKLGLVPDDFVLCYVGSTGTWYLMDEMLDFFAELYRQHTKSKFLMVTHDAPKALYQQAASRNINKDNLIIVQANRDEVPQLISLADFSILFIKNSFSKQGSSPTKLAESLAMGVPAIANAGVGDNDVLFQNPIGLLVTKPDNLEYKLVVEKALNFKTDRDEIRKFALRELSLMWATNRYVEVYKNMLEEKD